VRERLWGGTAAPPPQVWPTTDAGGMASVAPPPQVPLAREEPTVTAVTRDAAVVGEVAERKEPKLFKKAAPRRQAARPATGKRTPRKTASAPRTRRAKQSDDSDVTTGLVVGSLLTDTPAQSETTHSSGYGGDTEDRFMGGGGSFGGGGASGSWDSGSDSSSDSDGGGSDGGGGGGDGGGD
jgi:uncharacterized membrane protein YgcG